MSPSTSSDRPARPVSFAGRLVFVAGGGSGIGEGIAQAYANAGARVAVADIDPASAHAAADRLIESGAEAIGLTLDVADPTAWRAAMDAAEAKFGSLALLCNSAGIVGAGKPVWEIPFDRFARLFEITVYGVLHGIQCAVPRMRATGEHLVTVASMAALNSVPNLGDYSAAKSALLGLTDSLVEELEGSGIGVSIVFPGLVRTRLRETTAAVLGEPWMEKPAFAPQGYIEPDTVGRIVCDAVANANRYIFTHPDRRTAVAEHFAAIESGFDRLQAVGQRIANPTA